MQSQPEKLTQFSSFGFVEIFIEDTMLYDCLCSGARPSTLHIKMWHRRFILYQQRLFLAWHFQCTDIWDHTLGMATEIQFYINCGHTPSTDHSVQPVSTQCQLYSLHCSESILYFEDTNSILIFSILVTLLWKYMYSGCSLFQITLL